MENPYQIPNARLDDYPMGENTSGMGKLARIPEGVKGWSWGAFLLNWIWAIGNRTWIGLLCFVPYVGWVMSFVLGFKGREWAWRNKRWNGIDHFNEVQRRWSFWGLVITGIAVLGFVAAIVLPAYQSYVHSLRG